MCLRKSKGWCNETQSQFFMSQWRAIHTKKQRRNRKTLPRLRHHTRTISTTTRRPTRTLVRFLSSFLMWRHFRLVLDPSTSCRRSKRPKTRTMRTAARKTPQRFIFCKQFPAQFTVMKDQSDGIRFRAKNIRSKIEPSTQIKTWPKSRLMSQHRHNCFGSNGQNPECLHRLCAWRHLFRDWES